MSMEAEKYNFLKISNQRKIDNYLFTKDGSVDFYPNYIQLEHTNRCNASCIMCNHSYLENRECTSIHKRVIEKLEPILPYCSVMMLNGDGEPFLTKGIDSLLTLYAHYEIQLGTNTNLCALSENMIKELIPFFSFINVSCDGAKKETFEQIRRGLDFNTFLHNLDLINQFAPDVKKNLDVVLMRQNITEAVELVRLAHKFQFKEIRFHRMGVNPCIGNGVDADFHFQGYAHKWMQLAQKEGENLGVSVVTPEFGIEGSTDGIELEEAYVKSHSWNDVDLRIQDAKKTYAHLNLQNSYLTQNVNLSDIHNATFCIGRPCRWALERVYIDTQGNLSTCCYNVMKKMGNLLDATSFDELWNGTLYKDFRLLMGKGILPEWCRTCNWIKEGTF